MMWVVDHAQLHSAPTSPAEATSRNCFTCPTTGADFQRCQKTLGTHLGVLVKECRDKEGGGRKECARDLILSG